ncbi:MAG: Ig-like domain-containing protein, partial [Acidimicrobiales bacterium]
ATLGTVVAPSVAQAAPSGPAQFGGADLSAWVPGSSWTYNQQFNYSGNGSNMTINEVVTYQVAGVTTYAGYNTYKVNISGYVTGGGGSASGVSININNGSVSGVEYLRRSDLAMVYEEEQHNVNGQACDVVCVSASAQAQYRLTPSPPWRKEDFRLHVGDAWSLATSINAAGFLNYQSQIKSGGSNFNSTFPFDANVSVPSAPVISVPAGQISTDYVDAQSTNSSATDQRWWAPSAANIAEEHLVIPLSGGATGTINRQLVSTHVASSSTVLSEGLSPNLSCAGGKVTVAGSLTSGGSPEQGAGVTASLDQSALGASAITTATATTGASGTYQVSFVAPSQADGMAKAGVVGSWGIVVDAGGASAVATLEVVPGACAVLSYTGPTMAAQGQTIDLTAALSAASSGAPIPGAPVTFVLPSQQVTATTDASGIASAPLTLTEQPGYYTLGVEFSGGNGTYAPVGVSVPFEIGAVAHLAYTGPTSGTWGAPTTLQATLTVASSGAPIVSEPVSFSVDGQTLGAITNASGAASVSFTPGGTPGTYPLTVSFIGRDDYLPASASATFTVGWQYVFTDLFARGTVDLNPGNGLFEVNLAGSPGSGILGGAQMTVEDLPAVNQHLVLLTYRSTAMTLVGQFTEETGEFVATGAFTTPLAPIVLSRP